MGRFGPTIEPADAPDGGATPDHTRPADWKDDLDAVPLDQGENIGVAPVPPAVKKGRFGPIISAPGKSDVAAPPKDLHAGQTHPPFVQPEEDQRKFDVGRHDIRAEEFGPKQTGLESFARTAVDTIPGANLLMDEKKLEAARAWNPAEAALGDVSGTGAQFMAPVSEMGGFGKWLGAKVGPKLAQTARGAIQAGGLGAAQGASQAAKHGDAGDIAKGALIGGGTAAVLAGLGGLPSAEAAPGFANFLRRSLTTAARRAPAATAVYQGGKEALNPNATPYDVAHGALTMAVPPLATLATHAFQQGGASKIAPQLREAEGRLEKSAVDRANAEVPKKLNADYEHNVRTQRDQAENFDRQMAEGEGAAHDVNKGVDTAIEGVRAKDEYARHLANLQRQEFLDRQNAEAEKQNVQRQEYVARATRHARAEAEAEFKKVLDSYDAAKAATKSAQAASGRVPGTNEPTPEASALGEAMQIHGKAGTRLSHLIDAIERNVEPDDPEIRDLYKYVNDSLLRNNTREMQGIKEIRKIGFDKWVENRAAEILAGRPKGGSATAAPGPVSGPQMNKPSKPSAGTVVAPRVPVVPELEKQIISPQNPPNERDVLSPVAPKPGTNRTKPSSTPWIEGAPTQGQKTATAGQHAERLAASGAVPNFRDLEVQRPVAGPIDNGQSRIQALVDEFAREDKAKALAGAPETVRGDMTRAGVPPSRSIAKQYEKENPRLLEKPLSKAIDLLPTFRARRVAKDVGGDAVDSGGKVLSSITEGKGRPAEAAHILQEVSNARGKVDARRAGARRVDAGVAANAAVDNAVANPAFAAWLRKQEEEKQKKARK